MATAEWKARYDEAQKMYKCMWCDRMLKAKVSNSAKNPGRTFVSCSGDHGGCGMYSFLDGAPNEKFRQAKRARPDDAQTQGTNLVGPIFAQPSATDERLAALATEIAGLRGEIATIAKYIQQVNE